MRQPLHARYPRQARSGETERRLLDAAESLIQEKCLADASIPEIVRRAGSSVGGFYARFANKDALLRALEDRFFHELVGRLERLADAQRWADASLARIVEACVHELVSVTRARGNLIQAFLFRAAQNPEFQADALRFRAQERGVGVREVRARGRALSDAELRRELETTFLRYLGAGDAPARRAPTPRRRS